MRVVWLKFSGDEFRSIIDLSSKLKALDLPEQAGSIMEEVEKLLFPLESRKFTAKRWEHGGSG